MSVALVKCGHLCLASRNGVDATGMKRAAAWKLLRIGRVAGKGDTLSLLFREDAGQRRNESLSVRMEWRPKYVLSPPLLHHTAQIHDCNTITHVMDNGKIVRNEHIR